MSVRKFFAICAVGLLMNLTGAFIVKFFNLPVFLDATGTIFIASLGSYMPGIAVGFLTNLIKATYDPIQMYFSSVSILIAIFTTFMARKGYFDSLKKALILIPIMTLFVGTCALIISHILNVSSFSQIISGFNMTLTDKFVNEFFDKAFSVMMAFALLNTISKDIRPAFRLLGQMQAPLSAEMKKAVDNENYLSLSLRTKILLILMLGTLFISFSIASISYVLFKDATINDRIKGVDSLDMIVLNELDPNRIDDYIKLGRKASDYNDIEKKLYAIRNSSVDVKYLYVYRFLEEGCQVVFDLNAPGLDGDKPGTIIHYDSCLAPYKEDFLAGRPVKPIISNDNYGYLLTLAKPLYDSQGKCQCYVAIDFSMDSFTNYTHSFIAKLLVLFAGCFVVIFVIGLWFIENHILLPINTMAYCARNASYDNPEERAKHIEEVKSLQIHTGDEIQNLYDASVQSLDNITKYLEHLQLAKVQVANMRVKVFAMDELAHTDSLTGVRNKTAYVGMTNKLDLKIADGNANFCIVMIDVNFLKKVNDTYGHERGNEYLVNACKLVCSVFGEEHVYRIGGDEFVVVVEGEKVSLCRYFVKQFSAEMAHKKANTSLEPWEKISAAVGIAFYDPEIDKSADDVFKRADNLMYKNKIAMKAQRTD